MILAVCFAILILGALDYITTMKILKAGGVELNPLMRWCIERRLFMPVKAVITLLVIACLIWYGRIHPTAMTLTGLAIAAGYVMIVGHNVRQL